MELTIARRCAALSATVAALGGLLGASVAIAQPVGAVPRPPSTIGYLKPEQRPDHRVFLPPPPAADSALGMADMAVYRATRALKDSARWQLAARDNELAPANVLHDFACAVGVDLSPAATPAIAHLIARAGADLYPLISVSKDYYQRPRPFIVEDAPLCLVPSPALANGDSYPSGHSAAGWLYALLLAEADPNHAAAIVARGRAFGESRVVCGVHYVSDIEAGRTLTTALVAALNGSAEFTAAACFADRTVAKRRGRG